MASIIADASQTTAVVRVSEGDNRQVRALRDGALVGVDWYQALVAEGRVHAVNMGTASTPVGLIRRGWSCGPSRLSGI